MELRRQVTKGHLQHCSTCAGYHISMLCIVCNGHCVTLNDPLTDPVRWFGESLWKVGDYGE